MPDRAAASAGESVRSANSIRHSENTPAVPMPASDTQSHCVPVLPSHSPRLPASTVRLMPTLSHWRPRPRTGAHDTATTPSSETAWKSAPRLPACSADRPFSCSTEGVNPTTA